MTEGWRERPGTLRDLGYGGDAEGEGGGATMFVADLPAPGDDGDDAGAGAEEER